jgi:predicted permease
MQDLKLAMRQLRRSPGFAATVVLTLALGIGANTAIFTLVHAVLLKSLPVADPATLYRLGNGNDCCVNSGFYKNDGDFNLFSNDLYRHLVESAPEFEQVTAFQAGRNGVTMRWGSELGRPEQTRYVSGNYFSTFGVGAFLGRTLLPSDDVSGASPAVVISYAAWQADFASDPHVVGSTVYIQTKPFTLVGVAAPGFFGDRVDARPPSIWIPLADEPFLEGENTILHQPAVTWLYAIGRLKPGANPAGLQAKLSASLRQWLATQPEYVENGNNTLIPRQHIVLTPAGAGIQNLQQARQSGLHLLTAIAALVLLVACANIANLLLARGTARRAETSIRMALGAARMRLIRQMLMESVLLGCIGGALGLAVAYAGTRTILALAFPEAKYSPIHATPSLPVVGFALAVSVLTGVIFGIVPAWITSHSDPAEALRGINRSTGDRASLPQKSLIVFQVALSLVLLVGAGLLTRTLGNLEHQNFGLETANRYVIDFHTVAAGYTVTRLPALYEQIERQFSALPGVQSLGMATYSPLEGNNWGGSVFIAGRPAPGPRAHNGSSWDRVSTNFFETIGQPVIRGRGFTDHDTANSPMVAVVNEAFVKKFFPNEDPIGHHFGSGDQKYAGNYEIVGVVANAKYTFPREDFLSMYFRPLGQVDNTFTESEARTGETRSQFINCIILRFRSQPQNLDALVRRTMANIDPNLTIVSLVSMDYQVAGNFNQERLIARLTTLFGSLALILASVGLYGITAYSVARRTSEIGVRMALGATRDDVVGMVMRGAFSQVGAGLAIGIPVALLAARLIASQLYGVRAYDPFTLTIVTLVLAASAAVAAFVPAQRAATIEPISALRND